MVKYITQVFIALCLMTSLCGVLFSDSPSFFSKVRQSLRYKITQDHAPKGRVPTTFHEQAPKNEPLSRYGNPDAYWVDGKNYQVLTTAMGYKERGTASWYGMKFHKERTSSGELYDMYALTAAHKTLPLPTYIKVTNLSNGKQAIIKVNDRGPFHNDRILDLSYGASVKLGIFPNGTAPIEIEALTPGGGRAPALFYVQAGAFSTRETAKLLQYKVSQLTLSPVVIEEVNHKQIVRIGPFADRNNSEAFKQILRKNGIEGAFSVLG